MTDKDKVGNSKDLLLSKYIPLSVMILLSDTAFQADQPVIAEQRSGLPSAVEHLSGWRLCVALRWLGAGDLYPFR